MKHYSSPREKKVLILGLVALLSLPEAQLPPEVRPGMPQVGAQGLKCVGVNTCKYWYAIGHVQVNVQLAVRKLRTGLACRKHGPHSVLSVHAAMRSAALRLSCFPRPAHLLSCPPTHPPTAHHAAPQVTSAVLRLLLALKQQQEEHKQRGSDDEASGNESGAQPGTAELLCTLQFTSQCMSCSLHCSAACRPGPLSSHPCQLTVPSHDSACCADLEDEPAVPLPLRFWPSHTHFYSQFCLPCRPGGRLCWV